MINILDLYILTYWTHEMCIRLGSKERTEHYLCQKEINSPTTSHLLYYRHSPTVSWIVFYSLIIKDPKRLQDTS